jgi:predicted ester cyclase
MMKHVFSTVLLTGVCAIAVGQAPPDELGKPEELIVAKDLSAGRQEALIATARGFYAFWNSGDAQTLAQVISPGFTDHALPPGRPQGPGGPLYAIQHFREVVPDLHCEVTQQIIAGDRVVSHLRFTGHFSGRFGTRDGSGQVVDFIATDILRIDDRNQIADNWHLEDNLTFLQQIGAVNR